VVVLVVEVEVDDDVVDVATSAAWLLDDEKGWVTATTAPPPPSTPTPTATATRTLACNLVLLPKISGVAVGFDG
jgi:hypothetical protein